MLTHGGDDFKDGRIPLGQPLLMLALSFSCLSALFLAVIGLGKGCAHLIHQLPKALFSHRHVGKSTVLLGGFSVAKALVCKWHLRGLLEWPRGEASSYSAGCALAVPRCARHIQRMDSTEPGTICADHLNCVGAPLAACGPTNLSALAAMLMLAFAVRSPSSWVSMIPVEVEPCSCNTPRAWSLS